MDWPKENPIKWLELVMFALLIAFGVGLWNFVQDQLAIQNLANQPSEANLAAKFQVYELTQQLEDSKSRLSEARQQYSDHQKQLDQTQLIHSQYTGIYPQLASLAYSQTLDLSLSPLLAFELRDDRTELQIATIDSLDTDITTLISHTAELAMALEKIESESNPDHSLQLSKVLERLNRLQQKIEEQRSLAERNLVERERLKQTYPQLTMFMTTHLTENIFFDQIVYDYIQNSVHLGNSQKNIRQLEERIEKLHAQVAQQSMLLAAAEENVANQLKLKQNTVLWRQHWTGLAWTLGGVFGVIILFLIINLLLSNKMKINHLLLVFGGSFTVILISLSFEIAQI
ncbi:hypothetical protein KFU94_47375 [Chloroflexi bacterium TSY]|nr:hypothetical protein [Chloroflexi bacterium TSY]